MSLPRARITYEDYLQLPEGERYEVLEGDLRMVPAPDWQHQQVVLRLARILGTQVDLAGLGWAYVAPLDVILADDSVVQPDAGVVLRENESVVAPEGLRGAPDLAVEVLSPGTAKRDQGIKRRLYGRYGVREYWLIDPVARTLELTVNRGGNLETVKVFAAADRVTSPLLPTLELTVDELFR